MKRIAIVGAGFAGLALTWHLLQKEMEVTLFDSEEGSASAVSTGLLNPFPAKLGIRSWRATEGMQATKELLEVAEKALGRSVAERTGVLRLALQESIKQAFRERANEDPEAIWWDPEQVIEKVLGARPVPGLWIPSGITVYSKLYLQGLRKACQKARFEKKVIGSLQELSSYDYAILAVGAGISRFPECAHLLLEPLKGQALLCSWPAGHLPCGLAGLGHITSTEDPALCHIGSTYERGFADALPTPEAILKLKKQAAAFYPPAENATVLHVEAGVRVCRKQGYRPIVEQLGPKAWVFTGLGSRGLLYHALLARDLATHLTNH
ncbi:MAG: FAD-binding oxidoreductase [Verrucomicrobiota bacterium]|nr:FAD-binding oxidoreductase [Verrucomicrobiota bacterium]